jgi:[NiFe] hydrogenase diaphorase moiety large subunit
VGNVLLKERVGKILDGKGEPGDLEYLESLGKTIKTASRCGLGQTSPNPVLTTLANMRSQYEDLLKEPEPGMQPTFDLQAAVADAEGLAGRPSVHF